jgi:hypothetical protein
MRVNDSKSAHRNSRERGPKCVQTCFIYCLICVGINIAYKQQYTKTKLTFPTQGFQLESTETIRLTDESDSPIAAATRFTGLVKNQGLPVFFSFKKKSKTLLIMSFDTAVIVGPRVIFKPVRQLCQRKVRTERS